MRNWLFFILYSSFFIFLLSSCEHRELIDPTNGHYIRIYLDEEIKNVTCGFYDESLEKPEYQQPYVMRVMFTDPETGNIVRERYLQNQGQDERGNYIDGYMSVESGTYNLLAYSFGSSITKIRNEGNYFDMQAYTDPISENELRYLSFSREGADSKSIREMPEHLFHLVEESMVVRKTSDIDTLRSASGDYLKAHSVVSSYYLQLEIEGIEWVTSAVGTLSGMAGSTVLHGHQAIVTSDPVHLFFGMYSAQRSKNRESGKTTALLYTTFNTFGKIPDETSVLTLTFEFTLSDGSKQVEELDISPEFETAMAKNQQWILLGHKIVIEPPIGATAGGGMTPGVEGWEDVNAEVIM